MKRSAVVVCILLSVGLVAGAGDIATFQNLGFSPNSRYFMFGQYGISDPGSSPYADVFIVDVPSNRFVPGGVQGTAPKRVAEPFNNGIGALFTLLRDTTALARKHAISHYTTGRPLYILLDGDEPKADLQFRDFETGAKYTVTLHQSSSGSGENVAASFHIFLTREQGSSRQTHTLGLPRYSRKGVKRYSIRQVLLGPDSRSLVFVVEKEEYNGSEAGFSIRYMVETVRLD
jgi:predicted secreted protein